jgi:hypothetical protein
VTTTHPARPHRRAWLAVGGLLGALVVPIALAGPAYAASKTTICHATNSHSNPYRRISVPQSALGRHGNHHGANVVWSSGTTTRWNDVIPNGANGRDGSNGVDGKDGAPGQDGRDGVNGTDGAPGLQGERGPQGDRGPQGEQGPQGVPGLNGKDGKDAPPLTQRTICIITNPAGSNPRLALDAACAGKSDALTIYTPAS